MVLLFLSNLDYKRKYVYSVFIISFINTQRTLFENKSFKNQQCGSGGSWANHVIAIVRHSVSQSQARNRLTVSQLLSETQLRVCQLFRQSHYSHLSRADGLSAWVPVKISCSQNVTHSVLIRLSLLSKFVVWGLVNDDGNNHCSYYLRSDHTITIR